MSIGLVQRLHSRRDLKWFEEPGCPETLQFDWEFRELLRIYNARKPQRVLEVGSMFGGTLWHWFQTNPKQIVAIDQLVPPWDYRHEKHVKAHREFYEWAAKADGVWFSLLEGFSEDPNVIGTVAEMGQKFDFLFIDGDHNYEAVKRDFYNFSPFVEKGGLIVLHDILPAVSFPDYGVDRFWKELRECGLVVQELYSSPDQKLADKNGVLGTLGIGVIYV